MSAASSWFHALGDPLAPAERALVAGILAERGGLHPDAIVVVADWSALARTLQRLDRDDSWWDYEEEEREQLWLAAGAQHTEDELQQAIAAATDAAREGVTRAIAAAMTRAGVADAVLGDAALAAALLAIHHHALAVLAHAPDAHPFFRKHALFAAGRWPLGCERGQYHVF